MSGESLETIEREEVENFKNLIQQEMGIKERKVEIVPIRHGGAWHRFIRAEEHPSGKGTHQIGIRTDKSISDIKQQIIHELAHVKAPLEHPGRIDWREINELQKKYDLPPSGGEFESVRITNLPKIPKKPWQMTEKERMNISLPLKVPNEDTVYIFRKTDKAEVDNILSGGKSGQFWASKQAYPDEYVLIAKSNKRNISWEFNISHLKELLHWEKGEAVWTNNPKFIEPATIYNNHFEEVGESRTLKDIIAIVDEKVSNDMLLED